MIGKNSKIFVAGHNGMIGSAIIRKFKQLKYKHIFVKSRKQLDLTDQNKVFRYLNISKKNLRTNVSKYKRKIDLRGYKANIVETQKVLKWKPSVKFNAIIYKMIYNELF